MGGGLESLEGTFGEGPFTSVKEFGLGFVGNGQAPGILKEQKLEAASNQLFFLPILKSKTDI